MSRRSQICRTGIEIQTEKGLGDTAKEGGGGIGRLGLSYRDYFIHIYALYAHIRIYIRIYALYAHIRDTHG